MFELKNPGALNSFETPFYYYDIDLFEKTVEKISEASRKYGIKVHYAVKANTEPRLVRALADASFGADCVSGNEVSFAADNGFSPEDIIFAGVGKSDREIRTALSLGIACFNVESLHELAVIDDIASQMGIIAPVAFRVNPNVDAHTHKNITTGLYENKFGISDNDFDAAIEAVRNLKHISFKGIQAHIGSQVTDVESIFAQECVKMREIVDYFEERGLKVGSVDLGGGLGVDYQNPDDHPIADFETWFGTIRKHFEGSDYELHVEPGRSIVAQCGVLMTRVLFLKHGILKDFLVVDAGMNDLIRPALYDAYHKVENLSAKGRGEKAECVYDVVGPVCESSDVWGEGRLLHKSNRGDLICIRTAGAYGSVMASHYNLRNLAPAVFSDSVNLEEK